MLNDESVKAVAFTLDQ